MDKGEGKAKRPVLGRGLSALISTPIPVSFRQKTQEHQQVNSPQTVSPVESNLVLKIPPAQSTPSQLAETLATSSSKSQVTFLSLKAVTPNPTQPRQHFAEEELNELANSIRTLGVIQPILVRPAKNTIGQYEIVAGERRWRAAQRADLIEIPAVIQNLDDRETLEISIVENVQRANLNPAEEAQAYQRLCTEFSLSQQEVADRVGKDRATVANSLRLLKLPKEILGMLEDGSISMGHARALLSIREPSAQISLAKKAIAEQLPVRALESIVSRAVVLDAGKTAAPRDESAVKSREESPQSFVDVLDRLRNALGTKVILKHRKSGKGKLEIEYFSEAELDRVVQKICG